MSEPLDRGAARQAREVTQPRCGGSRLELKDPYVTLRAPQPGWLRSDSISGCDQNQHGSTQKCMDIDMTKRKQAPFLVLFSTNLVVKIFDNIYKRINS